MISESVTFQQGGHMSMACLSGKGHGKKGGEASFPLENSIFLAVASYMVYKVMVDWIKVLKVCVSKRQPNLQGAFHWDKFNS